MSWVMQLSGSRAWIRESNSVKWVIPQGFLWCCNLKNAWKLGSVKGEKCSITQLQATHSAFQTLHIHMLYQRNTRGLRGPWSLYIKSEQLKKWVQIVVKLIPYLLVLLTNTLNCLGVYLTPGYGLPPLLHCDTNKTNSNKWRKPQWCITRPHLHSLQHIP